MIQTERLVNIMERWEPVVGYEGLYEISSGGKLKNLKTGRCYEGSVVKAGYVHVCLTKDKKHTLKYIHNLVAEAFLGPKPDGYEVDHIDCNKLNNSLENLRYVTHDKNMKFASKNGLMVGSTEPKYWNRSLTEEQVRYIRQFCIPYDREFGIKPISVELNTSPSTVARVMQNRAYKEIVV